MKKQILSFLILFLFAFSISAQEKEARKLDEFKAIISCGEFMMRVDNLFDVLQKSPDTNVHIVYYGGRYRRTEVWDEKVGRVSKIKLEYPHREDALNRAKAIPLYLTTFRGFPQEFRDGVRDRITLIDGGFREDMAFEIWLVPKGAAIPKPSPDIAEKDIKFRRNKPYKTPNYACCYDYCN